MKKIFVPIIMAATVYTEINSKLSTINQLIGKASFETNSN
jgi:hypothetical protein